MPLDYLNITPTADLDCKNLNGVNSLLLIIGLLILAVFFVYFIYLITGAKALELKEATKIRKDEILKSKKKNEFIFMTFFYVLSHHFIPFIFVRPLRLFSLIIAYQAILAVLSIIRSGCL